MPNTQIKNWRTDSWKRLTSPIQLKKKLNWIEQNMQKNVRDYLGCKTGPSHVLMAMSNDE